MDVPIEESITLSHKYPSVIDRYFSRRLIQREEDNDTCILLHSNRICLVTLAKSHAICKKGVAIRRVNFKVGNKLDRSDNKVVGKGKRGGQYVDENSILCIVELADDSVYKIMAGMKGKLIEVNENLINDPELLVTKTETNGYIAVILQKLAESKKVVSKDEFEKKIDQ